MTGYFDSLRVELWDDGISVTQIYPGYINTNIAFHCLSEGKLKEFGKNDVFHTTGMSTP